MGFGAELYKKFLVSLREEKLPIRKALLRSEVYHVIAAT
jgi:hypothetical protein